MPRKNDIYPNTGNIETTLHNKGQSSLENQEQLQQQLREQQERINQLSLSQDILTSICNISPYSLHIFEAIRDAEENIIDCKVLKINSEQNNFSVQEVTYTGEDHISQEIIDFFDDSPDRQISEREYTSVDLDGKIHWLISRQRIFKRSDSGKPQQIILISQDITEKKLTTLALQENQQFIKSVADATPDMLYVIDLDEIRISYINKSVEEILHYRPEEIIKMGSSIMDILIHPHDQRMVLRYFQSFTTLPEPPLKEIEYRLKDAQEEWHFIRCRHTVFKKDDKGIPCQLIGVARDVTEYKKLEEERIKIKIRQQKAISEAILKTQEEERKRIAEALHNSLGQILYAAKLNLDILEPSPSTAKNNLELKKMVNELLEDAITETKTISFELMPAILNDFGLETALKDLVRKKLVKSGIVYQLTLLGLKNRMGNDLETAVFRIVQELVNNLIKHSMASNADIYVNKGSDFILIKLSDNGVGFNPQEAMKNNAGFGLLSIKNRVKLLNGKLSLRSGKNEGTQITIDIPLEASAV